MRKATITILGVLALIAMFGISATNLKFGSGEYSDSFPPWDKVYTSYERYYRDFGLSPEDVFIFIKSEDVSREEVLDYMLLLQRNLVNIEGVISASATPTAERTFALITVQVGRMSNEKLMEMAREIERVLQFIPAPPGVFVDVTGGAVLMYQITQAVREDVYTTFMIASAIMVSVLLAVFSGVVRRKRTTFFPLLIALLSLIVMLGAMPLLGVRMTEYVSSTVPILIGLSIDYAAQLQNRFEEERKKGRDTLQSITTAVRATRMPLFMALTTTLMGFASMAAPMIPSLFWFALLLSIGLVSAFFLSLVFLPAMLLFTDSPESGMESSIGIIERGLSHIAGITISNPRKILILTVILILIGAYATTNVQMETNRRKYAPHDLPALLKFEQLEKRVSPQYVYAVVLSADSVTPETIRKVEELARYISERETFVYSHETIGSVFVKFFGYIPRDSFLLSREMAIIPTGIKDRLISGNQMVILLYTNTQTEEEVKAALRNIKSDIEFFGWDGGYYITGFPVILAHLSEVLFSSMSLMTVVAYTLIFTLLLFIYRSPLRATIPLLSISVAIAAMNLATLLMGIKQTTVSIALNSIVLGTGIDYSIHISERYYEERGKFGVEKAVRVSIERTGKAVVTSALTTAGGFGALVFSSFPVLSNFGILAFIAVIFSLLAAISIVPAFLIMEPYFKEILKIT